MLVSLAKMFFIATDSNKSDQWNFIQKGGVDGTYTVKVNGKALCCVEAACASSLFVTTNPSKCKDNIQASNFAKFDCNFLALRSEERRLGRACRSRWSP